MLIEGNALKSPPHLVLQEHLTDDEENEEHDVQQEQEHLTDDDLHNIQQQANQQIKEEDTFTEVYRLKGSSFHNHFQQYLRISKFKMMGNTAPSLRCQAEPTNKRDENAVVVQGYLDGEWRPLGYIPAKKVPKVRVALAKKELLETKLKNVVYRYIHDLREHKYYTTPPALLI